MLGGPRTKKQAYEMEIAAREVGCIPCRMRGIFSQAQIHHAYGRPPDVAYHDFVYSCCPWHHQGLAVTHPDLEQAAKGPSMAIDKNAYLREFGTEAELVERCKQAIASFRGTIVGRS